MQCHLSLAGRLAERATVEKTRFVNSIQPGASWNYPIGGNEPLTPTLAKASAFAQATADNTAGRFAVSRREREWLRGA